MPFTPTAASPLPAARKTSDSAVPAGDPGPPTARPHAPRDLRPACACPPHWRARCAPASSTRNMPAARPSSASAKLAASTLFMDHLADQHRAADVRHHQPHALAHLVVDHAVRFVRKTQRMAKLVTVLSSTTFETSTMPCGCPHSLWKRVSRTSSGNGVCDATGSPTSSKKGAGSGSSCMIVSVELFVYGLIP